VGSTIAKGMRDRGADVMDLHVREARRLPVDEYDLVVFGSPTHWNSATFRMKRYIKGLGNNGGPGKPYSSFSTSYTGDSNGGATRKIRRLADRAGLWSCNDSLRVQLVKEDEELDSSRLEKARLFGMDLAEKMLCRNGRSD